MLSDMNKMKFFMAILASVTVTWGCAQGVYLDPSPTDVTGAVRLYVDISSPECNCPDVQPATPADPLYIWTWIPNEARPPLFGEDVSNGDWTNSNDNLVMTQDENNANLWYFDFLGASPAQFYDVPPAVFYESGIHFLVKKKDGSGEPERKSPDLSIIPEPVGCFDVICPFPVTFFQDEYFVAVYDNNIEPNQSLRNMGPTEGYMTFRYRINGGPELLFPPDPASADPSDFLMDYDGDGIFSKTMIPKDFFPIQEGDQITEIRIFVTKIPLAAPPFNISSSLTVGCPE